MQNSQISFTSRIRLVNHSDFRSVVSEVSASVDSPWTANEILKAKRAYTTGICDCTAGGITDGKDVVMFHIRPSENNIEYWSDITETLKQKIDRNSKKLRGFLLGSLDYGYSNNIFNGFEAFMRENSFPCTKFRGHKERFAKVDIAYSSPKDEWLVTSNQISEALEDNLDLFGKRPIAGAAQNKPAQIVENAFRIVEIAPGDMLIV